MNVEILNKTEYPEETVCTAARNDYMTDYVGDLSFAEIMEPVDGDTLKEKKRHLIENTLLKHGHYGPFEHVQATFSVEGVSRVLMAQLTRHRHASFDVQSMRYTTPDTDEIYRIRREDDYEALEEYVVVPKLIRTMEEAGHTDNYEDWMEEQLSAFVHYADLLRCAVHDFGLPRKRAKEDARFQLPLSTKVNIVFSANARMLMHIADMRAAGDAQWEIREMTEEVLDLAEDWMPLTFNYYNQEMKNRKNRLAP